MNFKTTSDLLAKHELLIDGAEIQGLICGMLCGGMSLQDKQWLNVIADLVNNGVALPPQVVESLKTMFSKLSDEMESSEFALELCLPDIDSPLSEQGHALINWVNGFNAGFGLHQSSMERCSDEVKEGLNDFTEIARMEAPTDDEDVLSELQEIVEYVRMTALLCFNELQTPREASRILH